MPRRALPFLFAATCLWSAPPAARVPAAPSRKAASGPMAPALKTALQKVSPESMRANLSFLASDALEGRATPSQGLDVAAEFIASRFRAIGLEPIPETKSYFQVADWRYRRSPVERLTASLESGSARVEIDWRQISATGLEGLKLERVPVFKADAANASKWKDMSEGGLAGSVVLMETVPFEKLRRMKRDERNETLRKYESAYRSLERLKPEAILGVRRASNTGAGAETQLIDPQGEKYGAREARPVRFHIHSRELTQAFDALPEGRTEARLTFLIPEAEERAVVLKNVVGILPGTDPALKDSYVLVSAHYDHVGMSGEYEGDSIFNGANDDASGTVSVIETASALAASRPRRTIVFIALFGEEKGLLGSYYYTRHPVFPLARTVANVNLEHMGRTDDVEGDQTGKLSMTGFDFSDVEEVFQTAAKQTGVQFYKREKQSDAFFNRSDNAAFAEAGIPAHTLTVSFEFPDYHGLGDHWDKIDYANLAKVNRTVVAGVWELANRLQAPAWNSSNEKTEKYRTARAEGNKSVQ